jgi:hypothetical protein
MDTCRFAAVVVGSFLLGAQPLAQTRVPDDDPRITTQLSVSTPKGNASGPIIVDVFVENIRRSDIRKDQFSPISSSVGLPIFRIVAVPSGQDVSISPGLFAETPNAWDDWYQPASGADAYRVGGFSLRAGVRVHLLHGDLRRMVQEAGEYCQRHLSEGGPLDKPEAAATKKEYEDVSRFARRFGDGGEYDVTVWAYARSNTVRIRIAPPIS